MFEPHADLTLSCSAPPPLPPLSFLAMPTELLSCLAVSPASASASASSKHNTDDGNGHIARHTSHQLCLVYIIITYLHICLPCIMLILLVPVLCFCLPCVIRLMGMLQLGTQAQKGARQEEIDKLPTGA